MPVPGRSPAVSASALASAFWGDRPGTPSEELAPALAQLWEEATAAWPEVDVEASAFMAFVSERMVDDAPRSDAIAPLRPGDLLLCHACLRGDPTALAAFDAGYLAATPSLVRRLALTAEQAQDVRQQLAQRLLVGTDQAGPRLSAYAGRGDLRNWVRTAALRVAQNLIASGARRPTEGDEALARAIAPGPDPALGFLQQQYGERFRQAFEAAVGELSPKERTLLRLAFVDGMTSDAIGSVYSVHRATAARWVASARDRLRARTRRRMMDRLGVGQADLQSIMRLIQSQLDVSVRRCLAEEPPSSEHSEGAEVRAGAEE